MLMYMYHNFITSTHEQAGLTSENIIALFVIPESSELEI